MPHMRSTGGIFARLDSNQNLTFYDALGNVVLKVVGGLVSGSFNKGTVASNTPIGSTTSLTDVHSGFYTQITPQVSGNIEIVASVGLQNSTAGDGAFAQIYEKSGAQSPAGGSAVTGWTLLTSNSQPFAVISAAANASAPVTRHVVVSGRAVGTVFTYAIAISARTGGTATFTVENGHPLAFEV